MLPHGAITGQQSGELFIIIAQAHKIYTYADARERRPVATIEVQYDLTTLNILLPLFTNLRDTNRAPTLFLWNVHPGVTEVAVLFQVAIAPENTLEQVFAEHRWLVEHISGTTKIITIAEASILSPEVDAFQGAFVDSGEATIMITEPLDDNVQPVPYFTFRIEEIRHQSPLEDFMS